MNDGIRDIALNAPKNKFGVNVQYLNTNLGLGGGGPDEFCGWLPCEFGGLRRRRLNRIIRLT